MAYPVYYPVENDTLPILFDTFAGSTGASVTMTGLAVTDIEIYKDGSATQRGSDAGYTLLDTDGIDFDGITGIHGFSIDLSDNTTAGFFEVGPWYHVVVSAITVDSQTVSFVAAAFRIVSATRGLAGTALPAVASGGAGGIPTDSTGKTAFNDPSAASVADAVWDELSTGHTDAGKAGQQMWTDVDAILADTAELQADWTNNGRLDLLIDLILDDTGTAGVVVASASKTGYTLTATTGLGNQTANLTGSVSGSVGSVTGAVGSVSGAVGSVGTGGIAAASFAADAISAAAVSAAAVAKIQTGLATPTNITAGTITTVTNLTNAPTSGDLTATMKSSVTTAATAATPTAAAVTGAVGSVTGNVGGNVGGNVTGSVGSVASGGITAASIATGAVDDDAIAANAVIKIQNGLAPSSTALSNAVWTGAKAGYLTGAVALDSTVAKEATVSALNNLSAAQVNAEVVDAINVDTYTEPGQGAPTATPTIRAMLHYLYKAWRNKTTQTAIAQTVFADNGTTADQVATVADDGSVLTRGEMGTGA